MSWQEYFKSQNITWCQATCDNDGKNIAAIDDSFDFHIWINNNYGNGEWSKITVNNYEQSSYGQTWSAISFSNNGDRLLICDYGGYVWLGNIDNLNQWKWNNFMHQDMWTHAKISGDGGTIVVIADYIHIGINYENDWQYEICLLFGSHKWNAMDISHNGNTILFTVQNSNKIYISNDRGKNIYPKLIGNIYNLIDVVLSKNGKSMLAIDDIQGIIIKAECNNYDIWKVTFLNFPINKWKNISASEDLSNIVVSTQFGDIYSSQDSGFSFIRELSKELKNISSVTLSKNGKLLVSTIYKDTILIKNNNIQFNEENYGNCDIIKFNEYDYLENTIENLFTNVHPNIETDEGIVVEEIITIPSNIETFENLGL